MLPLPLESAARLLSLLLSLLLHLLLRPESLLLLASVAVFWAAARHGPRLRSLPTSLRRSLRRFASRGPSTPPEPSPLTGGGPPCPPPAGVPWGAWTSAHRPRVTWQYRSRGVAVFALQGRREHMEDRFAVAHGEAAAPAGAAGEAGEAAPRCGRRHRHALYGVFDGHGGEAAAEYVKRRLPDYLRRRLAEGDGADVETALRDAVRRTEMELMETLGPAGNEAGTTCVLAVESAGRLYVANVGDSRAVLCDARGCALALSHDHKPHQLKERQRIKRAGGFISYNGSWRVQGVLAMSRSLGDFPLKRMGVVTAEPDVTAVDLSLVRPRFLLLASDGLWDAFGSQEAVAFVSERLGEPHLGAKSVALQAFYRGCPDNITVVVVRYRPPRAGVAAAAAATAGSATPRQAARTAC
ncbi:protein phosphatase 1L isoform X2 [Petromyzon marinus]|uniref:Protein phosphatase 1L isoform X2 n=1 Tax=Petromyzon marinus TaxID=7757 RepID=A0AAJ7UFT9_PETMA|nr:protein phosphatase 1L isoform X2 [Petromyzon marinus]